MSKEFRVMNYEDAGPTALRSCGHCGQPFRPVRKKQKYCSPRCREGAKNARKPLVRLNPDEHRRLKTARNRRKSGVHRFSRQIPAQSATRARRMPYRENSRFTHQVSPGNLRGMLSQVAVRAPKAMLRLAAALKEGRSADSADSTDSNRRVSCLRCECSQRCGDGDPCRVLEAQPI